MGDDPVKRASTAAEVARALGRKNKRVVLKWCEGEGGCPHDTGSKRGGTCFLFNLDEVKSWLAEKGLDVLKPEEPTAALPFSASGDDAAVGSLAVFTADGQFDWDAIIGKATAKLLEVAESQRDAQTKQRLTQAFKNASSELRALVDAKHKSEERAGKFIERVKAEEIVIAEAAMFVADLDSLATDLPRQIIADLDAAKVDRADAGQAARVLAETVRRATDVIRRRRAESIRRQLRGDDEPGKQAA